jgi:hypothetical protein
MVIATRILKLHRPEGGLDVPVRLHAPEEANGVWRCRYEVGWPHGTWEHAAQGLDSIQAIILALQMIGSLIYTSDYHKSGALILDGPGQGYGFPVTANLRDMLIGDDAKFF